jgi:hypothetical protein
LRAAKAAGRSACATNAKGIGFFRDRALVELPEAIFGAIKILGILRLRAHQSNRTIANRGAALRKTGGESVYRGGQRVADSFVVVKR